MKLIPPSMAFFVNSSTCTCPRFPITWNLPFPPNVMVPRQSSETFSPVFPRRLYFIFFAVWKILQHRKENVEKNRNFYPPLINRQPSTVNHQPGLFLQNILQITQTFLHILTQHTWKNQVHEIHGVFILADHLPYDTCLPWCDEDSRHRNPGRVLKRSFKPHGGINIGSGIYLGNLLFALSDTLYLAVPV